MRGHRDLRAAIAASVLCALLALLLPFAPLRLAIAAPLAFFLPGYAISSAAFARRPLDRTKLSLLSVGLSLAVLAVGALVVNYLPGGIRAGSWALLLVAVVLAACRAAALSRPRPSAPRAARPLPRPSRGEAGLLAGAALAAVAAIVLAFTPVSAKHAIGYTEMWIEPLASNPSAGVEIGVGNSHQGRGKYLLLVSFGREGGEAFARSFALEPGASRVLRVAAVPPPAGEKLPVVAELFREDVPEVAFRRVSTWILSPEGPR